MGISFGSAKTRDVDAEKHLKRMHKTVPWIESPLTGADHDKLVFSQRHEANSVELFFDLFFVANLATFTTYHSITDHQYLLAYVGFFGILWSCWFQVTLHDVRFARDSIFERVCKTLQFIVFVGLALVGSSFTPGAQKASNTNFRILCYTLVISRSVLAIQYMVILFYTFRERYTKLYIPLGLMIVIYSVAAIIFGGLTPAFRKEEQTHKGVYVVWYVVMFVEAGAVLTISSFWRMLSFKKTHLMERMSLLTLIVIGEGAIGVTKTVSRLMGKSGLDFEGCFLVMCVICVLVLLWALYFDNLPHGHFGTIRQQLWSILHFPYQLAVVGVVEGSQQVALARYVNKNYVYISTTITKYCAKENLDGEKLRDTLIKFIEYWDFEKKLETYGWTAYLSEYAYLAGNETDICSPANVEEYISSEIWPESLDYLAIDLYNGLYIGLGNKIPIDKLEKLEPAEIALKSWKVVYLYYWVSFSILISCSVLFLFLSRRHRIDAFDFVSVISRLVVLAVGLSLVALVASKEILFKFIGSPAVLPTCLILLFVVCLFDKLGATFSNWRLRKSGEPYAVEGVGHDHHGHEQHGHGHEHASHDHGMSPGLEDQRKSARWSVVSGDGYSDTMPLTHTNTEYSTHGGYAMQPLMSPPLMTPPIGGHPMVSPGSGPVIGGYMPVSNSQNYGA